MTMTMTTIMTTAAAAAITITTTKQNGILNMKLINICNRWTGKHYTDQCGREHSVTVAVTCDYI
jgi:hypothetical protein